MNAERISYKIAGHEHVLRDRITQAVAILNGVKLWIDEAVQASPQASIAWATICLGLPFVTKPAAADKANHSGFIYITSRMRYYVTLEGLMLHQNQEAALHKEFELHVIDLYRSVLDFQIRSVLRFFRSTLENWGRDLGSGESWVELRAEVERLERMVNNESQHISVLSSRQELEKLAKEAEESYTIMRKTLGIAGKQLQVSTDHLRIDVKQLSTQEQQLQVQQRIASGITPREIECLQLFRLAGDEHAGGYESLKGKVDDRAQGTCEWLLRHSSYKSWLGHDSGSLLVLADPGCGKSVLSKFLVDNVLPKFGIVCYFFFEDPYQTTLKQALCALLHQLLRRKKSLIRHAMQKFEENGDKLANNTELLQDILDDVAGDNELGPVIFVLDALDECRTSDWQTWIQYMQHFSSKRSGRSSNVKFFSTSRPYESIVKQAKRKPASIFSHVLNPCEECIEEMSKEIDVVIRYKVDLLAQNEELKPESKNYLLQRLLQIPHRTYLWIHLVFNYLDQPTLEKTLRQLEYQLAALPKTVTQAYEDILRRAEDQEQLRKVLCIILASTRPLTLAEMNVAMHTNDKTHSTEDLDLEDEIVFKRRLREWCGLFVSVYENRVYLLHQAAREFLFDNELTKPITTFGQSLWHEAINLEQANSVLAEICIRYLNFREFGRALSSNKYLNDEYFMDESAFRTTIGADDPDAVNAHEVVDKLKASNAFLDYATTNWARHFRQARNENAPEILSAACRMCRPATASFGVWFAINRYIIQDRRLCKPTNVLMTACQFGLDKVVGSLLPGEDPNSCNGSKESVLSLAAKGGFDEVVELLLQSGAEVNTLDRKNQSPLYHAASYGHVATVERLIRAGTNVMDNIQPLLRVAAFSGDKTIVEMLLNSWIGQDKGSLDLEGAVEPGCRRGHHEIIDLLLDWQSDVQTKSSMAQTALSLAAFYGEDKVISVILAKGGDLTLMNIEGALNKAIRGRRDTIIRQLLDSGVQIRVNLKDNNGWTMLHCASCSDNEVVVQYLLDNGVDVNIQESKGLTALHYVG